jgi:hypothetical protein
MDTQIVDFGDFRCDLDDPEVWDYLYPSFDTEVENGERTRDGAPKRKS